jgi:hypothetical protein
LKDGWEALLRETEYDRKKKWKKVRATWLLPFESTSPALQFKTLEETPKVEPEVLEEARRVRDELDAKCAVIATHYFKFREMTRQSAEEFEQPAM